MGRGESSQFLHVNKVSKLRRERPGEAIPFDAPEEHGY